MGDAASCCFPFKTSSSSVPPRDSCRAHPARRIRGALRRSGPSCRGGRSLAELRITAEGDRIVVSDGEATWSPESGQTQLDFAVSELREPRAPMARRAAKAARRVGARPSPPRTGMSSGYELEVAAPAMPGMPTGGRSSSTAHHADAHVNLGRCCTSRAWATEAERHYRAALSENPEHATAAYNLGIAFEDLDPPQPQRSRGLPPGPAIRPDPRRRPFQPRAACTRRRGKRAAALRPPQQLPATGPRQGGGDPTLANRAVDARTGRRLMFFHAGYHAFPNADGPGLESACSAREMRTRPPCGRPDYVLYHAGSGDSVG